MTALLAVATRAALPAPPEKSEAGVASLLAAALAGEVSRDAFIWERSHGALYDAVVGRSIVFLGSEDGAPREVYRARVRVTREGRAVAVRSIHNISQTPLGDETSMVARGSRLAYVARAFDAVQGVTVIDLDDDTAPWSWLSGTAPRRTNVVFEAPPSEAKIQLQGDMLVMALGDPPHAAALSLSPKDDGALAVDSGQEDHHGAHAWRFTARTESPVVALRRATIDRIFDRRPSSALPLARAPEPRGMLGWPPTGAWQPIGAHRPEHPADFYTIRVERDGDEVTLVALDTRRLELGIVAGHSEPRALTGPSGSGVINADARDGLVAVFNGGGHGGLIDGGRVLVPPRADLNTVVVDENGHARVGPWPADGALHVDELALLQGEATAGDVERSALCLTHDGFFVYGWSPSTTAAVIDGALGDVGCRHIVPLGAGGFGHVASEAPIAGSWTAAHGATPSAVDFFYLRRRGATPTVGKLAWAPVAGAQPPPTWWPAMHRAVTAAHGVEVELLLFAAGRFQWQIRPGGRERAGRTAARDLTQAELAETLVAIGLGTGFRNDNRRGLALDGVLALPIRADLGVLVTTPGGGIALQRSVDDMAPSADATELPLLAEGGKLRVEARTLGARRRRAAACQLSRGFVTALATADSDEPTTEALLELGCERVVELNRGKQVHAFIDLAGSDASPKASYRATTLYGTAAPTRGDALPLD